MRTAGTMAMLVLLGLATIDTARTADLAGGPYYTAPAALTVFSWAGPYLGGTIGYQWGQVSNNPTTPSGIAGGVEAGYNWQSGALVFGGETDIQLSAADNTFAPWQFSNPWFGTLRARAGVAMNNILLYGTAGLAYGEIRADSFNLTESHTSLGWVGGAGIEASLTPHWSVKAEWLYLDLADRSFALTSTNNGLTSNLLRMGVNYHF